MCVHVFSVSGMPNCVLVWVDAEAAHTQVYVDRSLFGSDGELTRRGVSEVNVALAAQRLGWSLAAADSCKRPALRAVAG